MNKILSLITTVLAFTSGVQAAGPFTVNTTSDTHSTGFSSQGAPGSTAVTDSGGHISLRSALEYACTVGGSTTINLPAGTYNLSLGDLVVGTAANTSIYIHGQGTSANTLINQTQAGRMVFNVDYNVLANVVFTLDNVTVTGGSENENDPDGFGGHGGAMLAGGSTSATGNAVTLTSVVFSNNYCSPVANAGASGGAIDMTGGGNLTIANCVFINNDASKNRGVGTGGAIYFDAGFAAGNLIIQNSTFASDTAHNGGQAGGVYLAGGIGNTYTITNDTFTSDNGGAQGGAMFLSTGNLTGTGDRITGNTATTASGLYMSTGTSPARSADVRNNWWGADGTPAGGAGDDSDFPTTSSPAPPADGQISFDPWIVLDTTANPSAVLISHSTTVTASVLQNSAGGALTTSQISALVGLPVTWTDLGDGIDSGMQLTIQANGTATATFTAGTTPGINAAKIEAEVDHVQFGDSLATDLITVYQLPALTNVNAATFTVGTSGSFTVAASGFPAPNYSETGALPSGVTLNPATGVLSGTPAAATGGTYPLTLIATNLVGTNTQSFTLTVDQAAAITSANSATFKVGTAGTFTATATGFPAPSLSASGPLPAGVSFTNANGILAGNAASGTGGVYPLTLTAHNGVGTDAAQGFTLTVNEAPGINCPANLTTNAPGGACAPAVAFAATASGYPAPVVSYKYGGTPIVSPTTFPLGTNLVSVTATNLVGTNTCSFNVTVLVGPLPVMAFKPVYAFSHYVTNNSIVRAISNLVSGQLTWGANASCYHVLASTNSLTNWFAISAAGTNLVTVPVDGTKGSVFYRLTAP